MKRYRRHSMLHRPFRCPDLKTQHGGRPVRACLMLLTGAILVVFGMRETYAGAELAIAGTHGDNVFVVGQTPEFRVTSTTPRLTWQVLDLDRTVVSRGELYVSKTASIRVPLHDPGYYRLIVQDRGPYAQKRRAERGFVVLSERDPSQDDMRFGVVTPFADGWQPRIMRLAARAGIRGIRDEQPWRVLEQRPQQFEFPDYLDAYVREARGLGLDTLIALTFGNPLYDDGLTPFSESGIAGFSRYGREVAQHFTRPVHALEVWNEFNADFATGPVLADRPFFYSRLLRQTNDSIKAVRPEVTVVGGAVAGVPIPYFRRLFEHGAMDALDALEIHPYRTIPEGVEYDIRELRSLAASFNRGDSKPIWATEAGVGRSESREHVAELLVRLLTLLVSERVDRVYWYLLRDQHPFVGLGLLEWDEATGMTAPTPAYAAYAVLTRMIGRARYVQRERTDRRTYIHLFETDRVEVRVAWAPTSPSDISLRARTDLQIVSLDGRQTALIRAGEVGQVRLSKRPIYIVGGIDALSEMRTDQLVADSVADFSPTQGEKNWWYGFYDAADISDGKTNESDDLAFRMASPAEDSSSYFWSDPRLPFLGIAREKIHPSKVGETPVPAVRRWRSPESGTMVISGTVHRESDKGDGVRFDISVGGKIVKSQLVGGPGRAHSAAFALKQRVRKGSNIDFVVRPGASGKATIDFDLTLLRVEIAKQLRPVGRPMER